MRKWVAAFAVCICEKEVIGERVAKRVLQENPMEANAVALEKLRVAWYEKRGREAPSQVIGEVMESDFAELWERNELAVADPAKLGRRAGRKLEMEDAFGDGV